MESLIKLFVMFGIGGLIGCVIGFSLVIASKICKKAPITNFDSLISEKKETELEPEIQTAIEEVDEVDLKQESEKTMTEKGFKSYLMRGVDELLKDGTPKPGKAPSGFLLLSNSIKHLIKSKIATKSVENAI